MPEPEAMSSFVNKAIGLEPNNRVSDIMKGMGIDQAVENEAVEAGEAEGEPEEMPIPNDMVEDEEPESEETEEAVGQAKAKPTKPTTPDPKSIEILKSFEGFPEDVAEFVKTAPPEIRSKLAKFVRDRADAKGAHEAYTKYKENIDGVYSEQVSKLHDAFVKNGKLGKEDAENFSKTILSAVQSEAHEVYQAMWQAKAKMYGGAVKDLVEEVTDESFGTWSKANPQLNHLLFSVIRDVPPKDQKAYFDILKPLLKKEASKRTARPVRASKVSRKEEDNTEAQLEAMLTANKPKVIGLGRDKNDS